MTISYWQDDSGAPGAAKTYDAVIVGAGIAGLSTAYWLLRREPGLRIALIDRGFLGAGASGRNAGFVTCGSAEHFHKLHQRFGAAKALEIWKFSEQNRELLREEIIAGDDAAVDFHQTGSCTVAPSAEDWSRYQALAATMQSAGLDVELIQEDYLARHYGVRNFQGAIQYRPDGIIHPVKLLKRLHSRLNGVDFYFGEEVFGLAENNTGVELKTQRHRFSAAQLFVCLNGYAPFLLPEYRGVIKPQRGQIVVTEPLPAFVKGPCYLTRHLCYFRQLPTGELLVGGFRNHDAEAENTAFDESTDKIQTALSEFVHGYFQNTADVKINYRWSGVMGFTPDGQMLVGAHPQRRNVYLMAGCSGHGMGLSFHAARVLAESARGGIVPAHLATGRFPAGL